VGIIGDGTSGVQFALSLLNNPSVNNLYHITRHQHLRINAFDWPIQFTDNKFLLNEATHLPLPDRKNFFHSNRHRGSVNEVLARDYLDAITKSKVQVVHGEVDQGFLTANEKIVLKSSTSQQPVTPPLDTVILATGYDLKNRPNKWLNPFISSLKLPIDSQGYPILNHTLQWGAKENIFVMGQMAENEIGPASRNLIAAKLSTERIMQSSQARASVNKVLAS